MKYLTILAVLVLPCAACADDFADHVRALEAKNAAKAKPVAKADTLPYTVVGMIKPNSVVYIVSNKEYPLYTDSKPYATREEAQKEADRLNGKKADCACTSPADCTCGKSCTCAACASKPAQAKPLEPRHGDTCPATDGGGAWTWDSKEQCWWRYKAVPAISRPAFAPPVYFGGFRGACVGGA